MRALERSGPGAGVQLVLAVDVGDAAGPPEPGPVPEVPRHVAGPTGRVEHQLGGHPLAVHVESDRDPVDLADAADVAAPDHQPGLGGDHLAQGTLEGLAPRAHAEGPGDPGTGDRLGTQLQPALYRERQLGLEGSGHLAAERMGVVELHHALARPAAVGLWSPVTVDHGDVVAAPLQGRAEEQPGGPGPDDRDTHRPTVAPTEVRVHGPVGRLWGAREVAVRFRSAGGDRPCIMFGRAGEGEGHGDRGGDDP